MAQLERPAPALKLCNSFYTSHGCHLIEHSDGDHLCLEYAEWQQLDDWCERQKAQTLGVDSSRWQQADFYEVCADWPDGAQESWRQTDDGRRITERIAERFDLLNLLKGVSGDGL